MLQYLTLSVKNVPNVSLGTNVSCNNFLHLKLYTEIVLKCLFFQIFFYIWKLNQPDSFNLLILFLLNRRYLINISIFVEKKMLIYSSVEMFVSNQRQNGWTNRALIFCVTSPDPKGRFMDDQIKKKLASNRGQFSLNL